MLEGEPVPQSKPRNTPRITLDQYGGIAGDIMAVNEPVADRFMQVADVRKEIVIVQMNDPRALAYEQLGSVRVGKRFRVPRWGESTEPTRAIRSDSDAWYIQVNDQALSRKALEKPKRRFDETFTASFRDEVNAGIRKILVKEKIINTDAPNFVRGISYGEMSLVVWDVLRFLNGRSVESAQDLGSEMLWMMGANATLMILAARGRSPLVSPENPFIRRNPREIVLPIVPVDRLARGVLYVQMHGKKMIEIPKAA